MRPPACQGRSVTGGVLVLVLMACAPSKPAGPAPSPHLANPDAENDVSLVIEAVVVGDARGRSTDTLFAPSASVTANGVSRFSNPRLAGVETGGLSAVTASEVNVRVGDVRLPMVFRGQEAGAARPRAHGADPEAGRTRMGHHRAADRADAVKHQKRER